MKSNSSNLKNPYPEISLIIPQAIALYRCYCSPPFNTWQVSWSCAMHITDLTPLNPIKPKVCFSLLRSPSLLCVFSPASANRDHQTRWFIIIFVASQNTKPTLQQRQNPQTQPDLRIQPYTYTNNPTQINLRDSTIPNPQQIWVTKQTSQHTLSLLALAALRGSFLRRCGSQICPSWAFAIVRKKLRAWDHGFSTKMWEGVAVMRERKQSIITPFLKRGFG